MSTVCPQDPTGAACPFNHFYGCDVSDDFEMSMDCSGEQYNCAPLAECDGAVSGLGEGSAGWDYTDQCGECDDNANTDCYDLSLDLHEGANLISFPALPADVSVANIFSDGAISGVIGEGVGAVVANGGWIGSLTSVSQDDGYWVKTSSDATIAHADAEPVNYDADGEVAYSINYGNNLISYPLQSSQSVSDALGNSAANVYAVAGEGVAALAIGGDFIGSLTAFEGGKGYWLVATDDFDFTFNSDNGSLSRLAQNHVRSIPEAYSFVQSDKQSFFFINSATIFGEELDSDDILIAYNDDVIVGARYWNGEYTDVPVMGVDSDNYQNTVGYCNAGDDISFKVLDASSGDLVPMDADMELTWTNMGLPIVNLVDAIPLDASLGSAYPNPFNPTTTLSYVVPSDMNVTLSIYDMRGRLVDELVNSVQTRGMHQVTWNADYYASGVYMVKLLTGSTVNVQKIMLVK